MPGFWLIQVWIQGLLQGGDDGDVDQGVPEAEIAQHSSEGSQEHSLVLQDPGVCGGGVQRCQDLLSPPLLTFCCHLSTMDACSEGSAGDSWVKSWSDWHLLGLSTSFLGKPS